MSDPVTQQVPRHEGYFLTCAPRAHRRLRVDSRWRNVFAVVLFVFTSLSSQLGSAQVRDYELTQSIARDETAPSRARLGAVVGGSLLGLAAAGLATGLFYYIGASTAGSAESEDFARGITGVSLGASLAPLFVAGGAQIASRLSGGVSRYDHALAGTLLGSALGGLVITAGLLGSESDGWFIASMAIAPLFVAGGAVFGTMLSDRRRGRRFQPSVAPLRRGGLFMVRAEI